MADSACTGPAAYRPRRPRDSPLYRLAEAHHETFKQVYDERFAGRYGSWRAEIERTLFAFLDCGVEERGFARVRCDACRREFRVALSCTTRVFCPSCHARRAVLWAEWLTGEVLAPVDHHQWVFTLPKRLRLFFLHDRRLLGALSRCAWRTVRDLYRAGRRDRRAVPGMVVSIQTYGDQAANWQPHLHALVTAGVVDGAGAFTPLPLPPAAVAEELFRRRVIAMLRQRGRLEDEAAAGLLAQRPPRRAVGRGGRRALGPLPCASAHRVGAAAVRRDPGHLPRPPPPPGHRPGPCHPRPAGDAGPAVPAHPTAEVAPHTDVRRLRPPHAGGAGAARPRGFPGRARPRDDRSDTLAT